MRNAKSPMSILGLMPLVAACQIASMQSGSLNGTSWTVVMIDRMPTLETVRTELHFADGRVSGTTGCNHITGSYSVDGNQVIFDQMATTEMMCGERQMAQEAKFLGLLKSKVTSSHTPDGDLILTNESGQRATLKRVL